MQAKLFSPLRMVVVLSSSIQRPQFVADPTLKAARERQSFLDAQLLTNPKYGHDDGFTGVNGAKAFGVALDPQSGQVVGQPALDAEIEPELDAPTEQSNQSPSNGSDLERIADLENRLAAQISEKEAEISRAKAQAFAEGQAQGQQEAKQMLEMESESAEAQRSIELRDMLGELISDAQSHLIAHQDLFDPLKTLALALAEQIARTELSLSDASLSAFIERSLMEIDPLQVGELVIHVSDDWYERLQQPELAQVIADYTLRRDDSLQPGSVRLAIQDTSIDDLIEHRLAELEQQVLSNTMPAPEHAEEMPSLGQKAMPEQVMKFLFARLTNTARSSRAIIQKWTISFFSARKTSDERFGRPNRGFSLPSGTYRRAPAGT